MTFAIVPVENQEQIARVASLAREIWEEFYVPLIGRAQVDYMVERFQSTDAVRQHLESGYAYFLAQCGHRPIGYFAVKPGVEQNRLLISKFYLQKSNRGAGTGRACMEFIEQLARRRGLAVLWLTVNKGNPSVKAYERLGFRVAADIVIDIGNGYVMDDYRMEKELSAAPDEAAPDPSNPSCTGDVD